MSTSLLYGDIPPDLVPVPRDAVQVSPLVPGAVSLEELAPETCDSLVMRAPPNTIERRHEMALALRALRPGADFVILAAKDKGGTRIGKELTGFGIEVTDQPRHHHRICSGTRPAILPGVEQAIADGAPRHVPELNLWSQPGLFSWDRFDIGSAVLIDVLPQLPVTDQRQRPGPCRTGRPKRQQRHAAHGGLHKISVSVAAGKSLRNHPRSLILPRRQPL